MWPVTVNGGTEMSARSDTFGTRSSGVGSTGSSATPNRTAPRLTWAKSAWIAWPVDPNSSNVALVRTRKSCSAELSMSVIRRWRVWIVPRTMNASVTRVMPVGMPFAPDAS